ncbi:hypothetical protein Esti_000459 [Eimeria stiedai]
MLNLGHVRQPRASRVRSLNALLRSVRGPHGAKKPQICGWFSVSQQNLLGAFIRRASLPSAHCPSASKAQNRSLREMQVPATPCAGAESAPNPLDSSSSAENTEPLVQYVVLRRDLQTELQWPLGAVVAQACHAAVAAIGSALEDNTADAQRYLAEGSNMRTVVLQVSSEGELMRLRDKLVQLQIHHMLWQEEPEKVSTALASIPIKKSAGRAFKGLKLLS